MSPLLTFVQRFLLGINFLNVFLYQSSYSKDFLAKTTLFWDDIQCLYIVEERLLFPTIDYFLCYVEENYFSNDRMLIFVMYKLKN